MSEHLSDQLFEYEFESRPYQENCTAEEHRALVGQVYLHADDVIYYKEVPLMSEYSANLMFDEVERYGQYMRKKYGILIDLTRTATPKSSVRRVINNRFSKICNHVTHVSFWTGKNILINTAARFVMYQTNLDSFSIHKTFDSAIDVMRENIDA